MLSAYLITAATIRPPTAYNRKILNILDKTTTLPVNLSQSKLYNCILERNHLSLLYCSLLQRQLIIQTLAPRYLRVREILQYLRFKKSFACWQYYQTDFTMWKGLHVIKLFYISTKICSSRKLLEVFGYFMISIYSSQCLLLIVIVVISCSIKLLLSS